MRLLSLLKRSDDARYTVLRRMTWEGGIADVGAVVQIDDPALARELVAAAKIAPADDRAVEHLRAPARWIEPPRTTSINPRNGGIFSRESPWREI